MIFFGKSLGGSIMYFDPLSTWLVVLIADGINIAGEKIGGRAKLSEYDQKCIKQANEWLNGDIRRVKDKYELALPEMAYEQIQLHIKTTKNSIAFKCANGQIILDLDNQEYIIAVLEECAKRFSKYEAVEKYREKAEWYKNAAVEARRKKELYAKELEESRIREAKEREKQKTMGNICLIVGLIVFVVFIVFFAS